MKLLQISAWNDSGGGFLNRLMDGHPELLAWPFELLLGQDGVDVDLFGDAWFRSRFRWPRLVDPSRTSGRDLFDAISDLELKSVLRDASSSKHREFAVGVDLDEWRSRVDFGWADAEPRTQAAFLELYVSTFFDLFQLDPSPRDRTVLGHCPVAILDAPEIWADFPDTRIIHVVRSPLSGFHDMQERHPGLQPDSYALKWSIVNGCAATLAGKYPDRVKLVTLAALLDDRQATMDALVDWARLGRSPRVYEPSWCGRALDASSMGPFGGVPDASARTEAALPNRLDVEVRARLESKTRSTQDLVDAVLGCHR